jgi:hypothetical protein
MLILSDRIIELNPIELQAAVTIRFPFNQFKTRRVQRGEYLRVTFPSTALCDFWKQKIFAAIPVDRNG